MDDSWVSLEASEIDAELRGTLGDGELAHSMPSLPPSVPHSVPGTPMRLAEDEELRAAPLDRSEELQSSYINQAAMIASDGGDEERAVSASSPGYPRVTLSRVPSVETTPEVVPSASPSPSRQGSSHFSERDGEIATLQRRQAASEEQITFWEARFRAAEAREAALAARLAEQQERLAAAEREAAEAAERADEAQSRCEGAEGHSAELLRQLNEVEFLNVANQQMSQRMSRKLTDLARGVDCVLTLQSSRGADDGAAEVAAAAAAAPAAVTADDAVNNVCRAVGDLTDAVFCSWQQLQEAESEARDVAATALPRALLPRAAGREQEQQGGEQEEQEEDEFERPPVISFTSFNVGDIAIFFPTESNTFLAFNAGAPNHYLAEESRELIGRDAHFRPYYVLGRIVAIEERVAEGPRDGGENNPYKLAEGTVYRVLCVASATADICRAASLAAVMASPA